MAINYSSTHLSMISEAFRQTNPIDCGSRARKELEPIKYSSLTGFYVLNYSLLIMLIVLPIVLITSMWR